MTFEIFSFPFPSVLLFYVLNNRVLVIYQIRICEFDKKKAQRVYFSTVNSHVKNGFFVETDFDKPSDCVLAA